MPPQKGASKSFLNHLLLGIGKQTTDAGGGDLCRVSMSFSSLGLDENSLGVTKGYPQKLSAGSAF